MSGGQDSSPDELSRDRDSCSSCYQTADVLNDTLSGEAIIIENAVKIAKALHVKHEENNRLHDQFYMLKRQQGHICHPDESCDGLCVDRANAAKNAVKMEELEAQCAQMRGALEELVAIKTLKDTHGKTPDYVKRQPIAWTAALDALLGDAGREMTQKLEAANIHSIELETERAAVVKQRDELLAVARGVFELLTSPDAESADFRRYDAPRLIADLSLSTRKLVEGK